jgi:hypothetical protein
MMKILLLLLLMAGGLHFPSKAQSIADLLIQLELDKEKLSAMKSTLTEMYQGYEQLKQGFTHIRDIAKANFNLHADFLSALLAVSPSVRGDPRINVILDREYRIVAGYASVDPTWKYAYTGLLQRCLQSAEELTIILTANELRMSDAERMQAIGRIDLDTQAQLILLQQLDDAISLQVAQRQQAARDINSLKTLYDLPN